MKFVYAIFFVISLNLYQIYGQNSLSPELKKLDSLKRELMMARKDSVKIRLRHKIGELSGINRATYWDSLANDAHLNKLNRLESAALANASECCRLQGDFQNFIKYAKSGIKIADAQYQGDVIDNLATNLYYYYASKLQQQNALDVCYEALNLAEKSKNQCLKASMLGLIGRIYWSAGDYNKAIIKQMQGLKILKELKDSTSIFTTLIALGNIYEALNDSDKAGYYYKECRTFYNPERNDPFVGHNVYKSVSAGFKIQHEYDSALFFARKAYEIAQANNSQKGIASCLCIMADINYLKGNIAEAKEQALEALEICERIKFTVQIPALTEVLKKVYVKEKNYKAALKSYETHILIKDSISNEKVRKQAAEKEYNYNLEKKENENRLLAQQNQIQNLKIRQGKYFSIGLGLLLLLAISVAFLFLRQNRFRNEQKNVQMEQKLLRTQMNPHFIFNALNTIQQFIITHENDKAQLYLSKFSRLMRRLLESNTKDSISLQEEVEILEKYLEIEALRFNNVFSYNIEVQKGLDWAQINIPHFLIQPFVENAIWHSLLPKTGDKQLSVVFEKADEKSLRCTIDDNGVGRQNKLREAPFEEKKSLAISFIKQRLELMSRVKKTNYTLILTDKVDAEGNNVGLKVIITLPIL